MGLIDNWLESLAEEISISKSCVRNVSPFSTCHICVENCPENAIEIKNKTVNINSNCNSCGDCIPSCPVNAIEGIAEKRWIVEDTLLFGENTKMSSKELLYYYHKGIRKIAVMDKELNNSWSNALKEANRVLDEMEKEEIGVTTEIKQPEPEEKELSRRELFSFFKKESISLIANFTPATWRFNHKDFSLEGMYAEWQFNGIEMNQEKCTLCQACFRLCPTKVFKVGDGQLSIDAIHCVSCKLCEDVCKDKAILITEEIRRTESMTYTVYPKTCIKCKKKFLGWEEEGDICHFCHSKPENHYYK